MSTHFRRLFHTNRVFRALGVLGFINVNGTWCDQRRKLVLQRSITHRHCVCLSAATKALNNKAMNLPPGRAPLFAPDAPVVAYLLIYLLHCRLTAPAVFVRCAASACLYVTCIEQPLSAIVRSLVRAPAIHTFGAVG